MQRSSIAAGPGHGNAYNLKRSRSISPDPLAKRRVPHDYAPLMYSSQAQLPPHIARSLSEDVTLTRSSATAEPRSAHSSQRLTPVNDCVRRTEALHLSTPPPRDGPNPFGTPSVDYSGGRNDDRSNTHGSNTDHSQAYQQNEEDSHVSPLGFEEIPRQGELNRPGLDLTQMEAYDDMPLHSGVTPHPSYTIASSECAPHEAPPLHLNLAGSPHDMSRSSSSSSSLATAVDPYTAYDTRASAIYDDSSALRQPTPATQSAPRPRHGWKVTFGYRSDCQKCIDKVPGHYSHVVMEGQGPQSSTSNGMQSTLW
ncbi:hypothetical protein OIV83_001421 [Microbotryomycetes sp. JL201]|nr:hypothetical protein OIV83_001421 [Microbotryomycetes sp. JL201]